jgi:hypothetical protein
MSRLLLNHHRLIQERVKSYNGEEQTQKPYHYRFRTTFNGHDHRYRWHGDLLQALGVGPSDRVQSWLAAFLLTIGTPRCFFPRHGYRVIAHDRRGHGRSSQTGDGHHMDHYADDLVALTAHLGLHDAVHVGHSTSGGEVVHNIADTARAVWRRRYRSVQYRRSWCRPMPIPGACPRACSMIRRHNWLQTAPSSAEPCRRTVLRLQFGQA